MQPVSAFVPAPPRTEVKLTVNAKGDYQWEINLSCEPGGEADMLAKMDAVNTYIARRYRQEVYKPAPPPINPDFPDVPPSTIPPDEPGAQAG